MAERSVAMIKIVQFAKEQGIELTDNHLQVIAIMAGGKDVVFKRDEKAENRVRQEALTVALGYLQDGLKEADPEN
jgi:hypothetical protein